MIISAKTIHAPRRPRPCEAEGHLHDIEGPAVRLFGCAENGDPPYVMWMCVDAARAALAAVSASGQVKLRRALRGLGPDAGSVALARARHCSKL